jgi:hypothetical protein
LHHKGLWVIGNKGVMGFVYAYPAYHAYSTILVTKKKCMEFEGVWVVRAMG